MGALRRWGTLTLLWVWTGCVTSEPPAEVGRRFRARGQDLQGQTLKLGDPGPVTLVVIEPRASSRRDLLDLWVRFQDQMELVWVVREPGPESEGLPFSVWRDPDRALARRAGGSPTSLLLDPYGRIVFRTSAAQSLPLDRMEMALRRALAQ